MISKGKIASRWSQKIYDAGDIDGAMQIIDPAKGFLEKSTKNKND